MSWEDLSPAQWRMLARIRNNQTQGSKFSLIEMKTAQCLVRYRVAYWAEAYDGSRWLTITFAGRVALRLHKELEAIK
jgi:hypothetical protein